MTGNVLIDLAISLAGILILVGLARLLFPNEDLTLTRALAAERLSFEEPDFQATDWLLDAGNNAAIARNDRGELATILVRGSGYIVRRNVFHEVNVSYKDGALHIAPVDHTSGTVIISVHEDEGERWIDCLKGRGR